MIARDADDDEIKQMACRRAGRLHRRADTDAFAKKIVAAARDQTPARHSERRPFSVVDDAGGAAFVIFTPAARIRIRRRGGTASFRLARTLRQRRDAAVAFYTRLFG